jgi:uncharacterized membrane protein YuzA (DUF378 family)
MSNQALLHMITFVLMVIGSLNWVLYGFVGWHLGYLLGNLDWLLYGAIGAAAVYEIMTHKTHCTMCGAHMPTGKSDTSATTPQ